MILPPGHPGTLLTAERSGINVYSERTLHDQVKRLLAGPGDRIEASIAGRVVDLLRADGEAVEVQTRGFHAMRLKAMDLAAAGIRVRIVHPIPVTLRICHLDPDTGRLLSVRKSPKRRDVWSLFDELVRAPGLIALPGVTVEALLVRATDLRIRNGAGFRRRRKDRTEDRILDEIAGSVRWSGRQEWLSLIPAGLPAPWSSETLGEALGIQAVRARKVLYCLACAGWISEAGLNGRRKLYRPAD